MLGDTNADGEQNLTDAVFVLDFLFGGGDEPPCAKSADADDSGSVDLTDPVFLLKCLVAGGQPPPAPFPECGNAQARAEYSNANPARGDIPCT